MEQGPTLPPKTSSKKWIWIIVVVLVLCLALVCCILIAGAAFYLLKPAWSTRINVPDLQILPTIQNSPLLPSMPTELPSIPTEFPFVDTLQRLDREGIPLFGSLDLQRGFLPDPQVIPVVAGGPVDTFDEDLDCGYTSSPPTLAFKLYGGASETFLRIFYASSDGTDAALLLYTPNQEWLCVNDSVYGVNPVVDIEFAPGGRYLVWVGMREKDAFGSGSISITGSRDIHP